METLWTLERRLWIGGTEIYRQNLHPQCIMVFAPPFGAMGREAVLKAIAGAPRWKDLAITHENLVMPRQDVAVVSYHAWAKREDTVEYTALCSSTWLEEGGIWRVIQHQQTPDRS